MSTGLLHRISENVNVNILKEPENIAPGTLTFSDIDVRQYTTALLLVSLGTVAVGGTVDATIRISETAGGTYTDVFTATQLVQADEDKTYYLDIDLRNANLEPFLEIELVFGTAASDASAYLLLEGPRDAAVNQADLLPLAGTWAAGILPPI